MAVLTSFLPHKKFTWTDFGGIYIHIPIYTPVATPLAGEPSTAASVSIDTLLRLLLLAYYHEALLRGHLGLIAAGGGGRLRSMRDVNTGSRDDSRAGSRQRSPFRRTSRLFRIRENRRFGSIPVGSRYTRLRAYRFGVFRRRLRRRRRRRRALAHPLRSRRRR